jgi:hypothetical protein
MPRRLAARETAIWIGRSITLAVARKTEKIANGKCDGQEQAKNEKGGW